MPVGIYEHKRKTLAERFWPKVNKDGPIPPLRPDLGRCWIWTASTRNGYGGISVGGHQGKTLKAHRVSYELMVGPIPPGLEPDHLCRNPPCVNPAHIEVVTHRANMLRGENVTARNARVTVCPQGHPYDLLNTAFWSGNRHCRACEGARSKRRTAANKKQPSTTGQAPVAGQAPTTSGQGGSDG